MPIKVSCSCGQSFKAKDELGGKKVRCPKCQNPLTIPAAAIATPQLDDFALAPAEDVPKYNPLEDLLAEEGVKEATSGPTCPSCGEGISPTAILCVQCGFNLTTGEKISMSEFDDDDDDEAIRMAGMSETDKMLYKAEKELEGTPISAEGEKFGDEGDSYFVAIGAILGALLLTGLAVGGVIAMDSIEGFNPFYVSRAASVIGWLVCWFLCVFLAFRESQTQGLLCLCTVSLYGIFFYVWTRGYLLFGAIWAVLFIVGLSLVIAGFTMEPAVG